MALEITALLGAAAGAAKFVKEARGLVETISTSRFANNGEAKRKLEEKIAEVEQNLRNAGRLADVRRGVRRRPARGRRAALGLRARPRLAPGEPRGPEQRRRRALRRSVGDDRPALRVGRAPAGAALPRARRPDRLAERQGQGSDPAAPPERRAGRRGRRPGGPQQGVGRRRHALPADRRRAAAASRAR